MNNKPSISLFIKLYTPEMVDSVSIFGDYDVVGNFDANKAIAMKESEMLIGKMWLTELKFPCSFGILNYKYIINGKEEILRKARSINLSGFSIYIYDKLSDETLDMLEKKKNEENYTILMREDPYKKKNTKEIVQQQIDMNKIHRVVKDSRWLNNNFELRIHSSETKYKALDENVEEKITINMRPQHQISTDQTNNFLIFTAPSINELSIWADIIHQNGETLASVFISYQSMLELSGILNLPVVDYSKGLELGTLTISFQIITPFKHPFNTLEHISQNGDLYENAERLIGALAQEPAYIGHRGSGMTTNPNQKHIFVENTLLSFFAAKKSGSDFIEFDVQLTKDLVPVIAHDDEIMIPTKTKDGKDTVVLVPVNKIEFATLQKLQPFTVKNESQIVANNSEKKDVSPPPRRLKRNNSNDSLPTLQSESHQQKENEPKRNKKKEKKEKLKEKEKKDILKNEDKILEDKEFWKASNVFPSLEQIFKHLPASVGFNVEIKYPDEEEYIYQLSSIERNKYVDKILKVIFFFSFLFFFLSLIIFSFYKGHIRQ